MFFFFRIVTANKYKREITNRYGLYIYKDIKEIGGGKAINPPEPRSVWVHIANIPYPVYYVYVYTIKANKKRADARGIIELCVQKGKYYTEIRKAFDSNQINEVSFNKLYSGLIWNY